MGPSLELAFRMGKQKRSISHPLCSVEPTRFRLLVSRSREVPSFWPFPPPGIKGTVGFALLILQASLGGANPVFFLLECANTCRSPYGPWVHAVGFASSTRRVWSRLTTGVVGLFRLAVIARKVSHCSKSPRGAAAFAASVSVLRTVAQSGVASTIHY